MVFFGIWVGAFLCACGVTAPAIGGTLAAFRLMGNSMVIKIHLVPAVLCYDKVRICVGGGRLVKPHLVDNVLRHTISQASVPDDAPFAKMDSTRISYQAVSSVHKTWEMARQQYTSEGEFGAAILLGLFDDAPGAKAVFGLDNTDLPDAHVVHHGMRIVQMLDGVLTLLGPNMDMLEEILGKLGERHRRLGIDKTYIILVGSSVRRAIGAKLKSTYTSQHDKAWQEVFALLSGKIIKNMY